MRGRAAAMAAVLGWATVWTTVGVSGGCGWFDRAARKRAQAEPHMPADLIPQTPPKTEPRRLLMRVWADSAHRRSVLGWQVRFHETVVRANRLLESRLGVTLQIAAIKPWRQDLTQATLPDALADLNAHDPGQDVDFVVGLVTGLPMVTASYHQLGMARPFGKHVVLRGMDDAQEFRFLKNILTLLSEDESDRVYAARLRHKETTVFLHEIAHSLGGIHGQEPTSILHPTYSHKVSHFVMPNVELMQIALEARGEGRRSDDRWYATLDKLARHLITAEYGGWVPQEQARMRGWLTGSKAGLQSATDLPVPKGATGPDHVAPIPETPAEKAMELARLGELDDAWAQLEPNLEKNDPQDHRVACYLAVTAQRVNAKKVCEEAARLGPEDPSPLLQQAEWHLRRDETEPAIDAVAEAHRRLDAQKDPQDAQWALLADLFRRLSLVTWAMQAARQASSEPSAVEIVMWGRSVKRNLYLPDDAERRGVPPRREAAYLALRKAMADAVQQGRVSALHRFARRLRAQFRNMPTANLEYCTLYTKQKDFSRALTACSAARRSEPTAFEPRIRLAVAAFSTGQPGQAVRPLQEALKLDDTRTDVWTLLASAYRYTRQDKQLAVLRAQYRSRFGTGCRAGDGG